MSTSTPGPWSSEDAVRWWTSVVVGSSAVAVGWWQASGRALLADQLLWAGVCIGGLLVASCGHLLWVLRGRAAVGRRRLRLLPDLVARTAHILTTPANDEVLLVAGSRLHLFHRADCQLASGRSWPAATLQEHVAAGRISCGVCLSAAAEQELPETTP